MLAISGIAFLAIFKRANFTNAILIKIIPLSTCANPIVEDSPVGTSHIEFTFAINQGKTFKAWVTFASILGITHLADGDLAFKASLVYQVEAKVAFIASLACGIALSTIIRAGLAGVIFGDGSLWTSNIEPTTSLGSQQESLYTSFAF